MKVVQPPISRELLAVAIRPGFRTLAIVVRVVCMLPFVTGAFALLGGTQILALAGANLPRQAALDPDLNNQIRFWAAAWFGYGILLWWASRDLRGRTDVFRIIMALLLLGGLGRALSVYLFGWGVPFFTFSMVVEIGGPIGLTLWHNSLLGRV